MVPHPTSLFNAYVQGQQARVAGVRAVEQSLGLDGVPCSCTQCRSARLVERKVAYSEYDIGYTVVCADCRTKVGDWDQGHYIPVEPPQDIDIYF